MKAVIDTTTIAATSNYIEIEDGYDLLTEDGNSTMLAESASLPTHKRLGGVSFNRKMSFQSFP